jgi:microcin C transport system substrate-binding protein
LPESKLAATFRLREASWNGAVRLFTLLISLLIFTGGAWAQDGTEEPRAHGFTVLGKPKLPADFQAFPYVNVNAPKGGTVNLAAVGTFDSFNPFILRGTAEAHTVSPWITLPGGAGSGSTVGHLWETLLTSSADEIATGYCHICETIEVPADKTWVAFNLRPEAKFSDGTPITADDIAWTFNTLLAQGRPSMRVQFVDVKDVEVEGPSRVRFNFKSTQNRELPLMVGGLPVLPKHFFDGRDFTAPLTATPIGSGPYRISGFELGRSVTYTRDPNWWAADLPTGRGTNNFGTVRIEYFRDATVAMEAFKAGQADIRAENIAKNWATAYDFPAVKDGLVLKREYQHELPTGIQGYAMNTRRAVFADPRVRQAVTWAFDFEWTNKNLFYGAYKRTTSYFSNTDLAATGLPSQDELNLLRPYHDSLPPNLFKQPFSLPVTDGSGNNREQLVEGLKLLREAGWQIKDRKLVMADGQPAAFTILLDDPSLERVALPYVQNLRKLGFDVQVRTVDPAQFQHLTDDFDYDMIMMIYPGSDIPGSELRDYWSCAGAKTQGSSNVPGICSPAIDAMIEKVIAADDRDTLRVAARALDRLLLWNWYMVPNWYTQDFHIAYWDRFGEPGIPIREGINFDSWWVDPQKAAKNDAARH